MCRPSPMRWGQSGGKRSLTAPWSGRTSMRPGHEKGGQRASGRGGLTTKLHVACAGRSRHRKRPDHLIGDKGYSYPRCRRMLRRRGIPHTIPGRIGRRASRLSIGIPTGGATWSSEPSTNAARLPPGMPSGWPATGQWWSSPASCSGWARDSSDRP